MMSNFILGRAFFVFFFTLVFADSSISFDMKFLSSLSWQSKKPNLLYSVETDDVALAVDNAVYTLGYGSDDILWSNSLPKAQLALEQEISLGRGILQFDLDAGDIMLSQAYFEHKFDSGVRLDLGLIEPRLRTDAEFSLENNMVANLFGHRRKDFGYSNLVRPIGLLVDRDIDNILVQAALWQSLYLKSVNTELGSLQDALNWDDSVNMAFYMGAGYRLVGNDFGLGINVRGLDVPEVNLVQLFVQSLDSSGSGIVNFDWSDLKAIVSWSRIRAFNLRLGFVSGSTFMLFEYINKSLVDRKVATSMGSNVLLDSNFSTSLNQYGAQLSLGWLVSQQSRQVSSLHGLGEIDRGDSEHVIELVANIAYVRDNLPQDGSEPGIGSVVRVRLNNDDYVGDENYYKNYKANVGLGINYYHGGYSVKLGYLISYDKYYYQGVSYDTSSDIDARYSAQLSLAMIYDL